MLKSLNNNLISSKIRKIASKISYLIIRPIRPPAGMIGFKEYAGQIRVNRVSASLLEVDTLRNKLLYLLGSRGVYFQNNLYFAPPPLFLKLYFSQVQ